MNISIWPNLASIADFAQRMHARQSLDLLVNNAV